MCALRYCHFQNCFQLQENSIPRQIIDLFHLCLHIYQLIRIYHSRAVRFFHSARDTAVIYPFFVLLVWNTVDHTPIFEALYRI